MLTGCWMDAVCPQYLYCIVSYPPSCHSCICIDIKCILKNNNKKQQKHIQQHIIVLLMWSCPTEGALVSIVNLLQDTQDIIHSYIHSYTSSCLCCFICIHYYLPRVSKCLLFISFICYLSECFILLYYYYYYYYYHWLFMIYSLIPRFNFDECFSFVYYMNLNNIPLLLFVFLLFLLLL